MQLTDGGWQGSPRWSPDGERIAYDSQGIHPLASIDGRALVAADGIYYPECDEDMKPRLHHLDPKTGRDRVLGVADGLAFSLAVSPDSRTILFTRIVGVGNDLMMIDSFH